MLVEGLNVQITVGLNKLEEIRQEEIVIQQREKEIEIRISRTQLIWSSHLHFLGRHGTTHHHLWSTVIKTAQQSLRRLDEIALKPDPLTQVEYLELLIESEKMEAKPGWKQRVKYLDVAKRHAEMLSKVKDKRETQKLRKQLSRDVDISEEQTRDSLEKLSLGQDKWYSRFKFW